jgi:hypothetical protein
MVIRPKATILTPLLCAPPLVPLAGCGPKNDRTADGSDRMPPQGGNPRLSDAEVRLSRGYLVATVAHCRSAGLRGTEVGP